MEAWEDIILLETKLKDSLEENSQIKSDLERKDKNIVDLDGEVSSLKSLLEQESKSEKETASKMEF